MSTATMSPLAIDDAEGLLFGKAPRPVRCGFDLTIGQGLGFPEVNFTLPLLEHEYGQKLSFCRGISTEPVMSQGDAELVRKTTLECARLLAPSGTGLVLGPSHRMQSDIPPKSVDAMLEAFRELEG